jgi:hypothetical protein
MNIDIACFGEQKNSIVGNMGINSEKLISRSADICTTVG